jgi:cation diffusion facilitator family transporter
MLSKFLDWFGFSNKGEFQASSGHDHGSDDHGHTHGVIDASITTTDRGIWAIKWSFVILAITTALQIIVVALSSSVALLADTIHNLADATTAIPLWVAFVLVRRPPTKVFNYGLGRVEDLAGILIVGIILFSAVFAGYEAINRLIHPQPIAFLGWVAVAGVIGFLGNETVAVFRIKVGREIQSAALIADGYHARTDGFTSLAVVLGAVGVWAGFPLADPIFGLLITITIFGIVWQSAKSVVVRALDGVEPAIVDEIQHAAEHVKGIKIVSARARWIGHRLHTDVAIAVDDKLPVNAGVKLAEQLRSELLGHISALRTATVTFASPNGASPFELAPLAHASHHALESFLVNSKLASGELAIVNTVAGERFRLSLSRLTKGIQAIVVINRFDGKEKLPLKMIAGDPKTYESSVAPAEPHEFIATLILKSRTQTITLPFEMKELQGHHH